MTDASGTNESLDGTFDEADVEESDLDETAFDRTRTDYTGAVLDDEFQPVDDVELAEAGLLLDDPERVGLGADEDELLDE